MLKALPILALVLIPTGLWAQEPVRLVNQMTLSPDGTELVIAWRGDLWKVPAQGGTLQQLTWHPAEESRPLYSPDGTKIAFNSDRTGSRQIYTMSIQGGPAQQHTVHSEGSRLEAWFPDGQSVLISGRRDHHWRPSTRLFRLHLSGEEQPTLLFDGYGSRAAISPDGNRIAFCREGVRWWRKGYTGSQASQIWTYDIKSGQFTKLSDGEHLESWPLWHPDGKHIYYISEENGTSNLWLRQVETGQTQRLTDFEDDGPRFPVSSGDGSTIAFQRLFDLYVFQPGQDSLPQQVTMEYNGDSSTDPMLRRVFAKASQVVFSNDGHEIAFVAGGDLWVMDTELKEPIQVTRTPEEESDPVFSPDFESLYFVSEQGGQPDIWRAQRADTERYWWQNTEFELKRITNDPDPEYAPRFTPDGKRLAFLRLRGDLWLADPDGKNPQRILHSWNQPDYDFSPDGQWIVYAASDNDFNRDIWIQPVDGSTPPFNLSRHPDNESNPRWSPDGKLIAFTGRRWEDETDIYYVWLHKEDEETSSRDRKVEKAIEAMKGRKKDEEATDLTSIDGTWILTIKDSPLGTKAVRNLQLTLDDDQSVSGTFRSKEDEEIASLREGVLDPENEELTFQIDLPEGLFTITLQFEGKTASGTWSLPNEESGAITARRQSQKDETPEVHIDFEDLSDRIHRISIPNSSENQLLWSPDSKKLAFWGSIDGASGLYQIEFPSDLKPKLLTKTAVSGSQWLKSKKKIATSTEGVPAILTISGSNKATVSKYPFKVRHEVDRRARHGAAFDQAWRIMRDHWYDSRLGNRNWDSIGRKYRPLAAQAQTASELVTVTSMMLGELNGSHLGFWTNRSKTPAAPAWTDVTAHFGLRFDRSDPGPGLLIRDVIEGSPAAESEHGLAAGERLLRINSQTVDPSLYLDPLLTGDIQQDYELVIRSLANEERTIRLRPITYREARRLLYRQWIENNRKTVDRESSGQLGYLHIRGMNWDSFQQFDAELYKVGHGKSGLVIDVRENGGGYTTDHLLTCLTQPVHAITIPRGGGPGYPQSRKVYASWSKPIIVLCNQNSFSNAEIFSHAIKTLKRGQIVGVKTAGGVISTGSTKIMDLGTLRLPFRGWFLLETGDDMELNGCQPDHEIWPQPGEIPAGIDRQLEKAIEVLLSEVRAEQTSPPQTLRRRTEKS